MTSKEALKNYLKLKVKIKDKFYGVYGEPSNFKAVKYMSSVIVPDDSEYYKVGDVVLVLTFNYQPYLNICLIADKDTLIDLDSIRKDEVIKPFHFEKGASYVMGQDYYYYLAKDHGIYDMVELAEDYEDAFKQFISRPKRISRHKKRIRVNRHES